MNGKEKVAIARLEEKQKAMHSDVLDLKELLYNNTGEIKKAVSELTKTSTKLGNITTSNKIILENHLKNHDKSFEMGKKNIGLIGTLIAVVSLVVTTALNLMRGI